VKALDRQNIGTIDHLDDHAGTVHVTFVAADGRIGERDLPWDTVVILDRAAPTRPLSDAAQRALQRYRASIEPKITQWNATVTALGSYPAEVDHMGRAIHQHVTAGAAQLTGTQPGWLDQLIGPRPADPIGEATWDNAAADIAAWRSRHDITAPGLGAAPADTELSDQWAQLTRRLAATRSWLAAVDRHEPSWPAIRSHHDLIERRRTLETIFDGAPADTRPLIHAVRAGQLALADVDEILHAATATRDARQHWILEHWPHVVEYAEINDTLAQQSWGPDTRQLLDGLDEFDTNDDLRDSIDAEAPWLQAAMCALDTHDADQLTDAQIDWLNDVANYRSTHHVTSRDPLGAIPDDADRNAAFDALLSDLGATRRAEQPEPHLSIEL
jgi:hypothetical protein